MMKCQFESCEARQMVPVPGGWVKGEGREAPILVIAGPRKVQTPVCEQCARYWTNTMPGETWIVSLSTYVDNYELAKAQLERAQDTPLSQAEIDQRRQDWFARCPEDVLRRFASATATGDDLRELDKAERPAGAILHSQEHYEDTALKMRGLKTILPYQQAAERALWDRGMVSEPQLTITGAVINPRPSRQPISAIEAPRHGAVTAPPWRTIAWLAGGLTSFILGIVCCHLAVVNDGQTVGPQHWYAAPGMYYGHWRAGYWAPAPGKWHIVHANGNLIGLGVLLIAAPFLAGLILGIRKFVRWHEHQLRNLTPAQRKAVHYAELVGALAAADIGLRAYNKRSQQRTATMREHIAAAQQDWADQRRTMEEATVQAGMGMGNSFSSPVPSQGPAAARRRAELDQDW